MHSLISLLWLAKPFWIVLNLRIGLHHQSPFHFLWFFSADNIVFVFLQHSPWSVGWSQWNIKSLWRKYDQPKPWPLHVQIMTDLYPSIPLMTGLYPSMPLRSWLAHIPECLPVAVRLQHQPCWHLGLERWTGSSTVVPSEVALCYRIGRKLSTPTPDRHKSLSRLSVVLQYM